MINKPIFKPHYCVEIIIGEGVLLLSEDGNRSLYGRLYEHIVPLIDGNRTSDEIVDSLEGRLSPAETYYTLSQLEKKGYITEAANTLPDGEAAYWWGQDIDPIQIRDSFKNSKVSITSYGDIATDSLKEALGSFDIRIGNKQKLDIIVTDNYLRTGLEKQNKRALKSGTPWLMIKPVGNEIWIGPLFIPKKAGCYTCLKHRLVINHMVERFAVEKSGKKEPIITSRAVTPNSLSIAFHATSLEIAKWLVKGENKTLEGKILSLDTRTWASGSHTLIRRPQCPDCGKPDKFSNRKLKPIKLKSRKVLFTRDSGYRTATPEETIRKYDQYVSHITGVVTSLVPTPTSDEKVHVYYAGHNFAMKFESLDFLKKGLRSGSGGKGVSDIQAKASGLCEVLERDSGRYDGTEPKITASYRRLGDDAIHPNHCMLYSKKQYRERKKWNKRGSKFNVAVEPFNEEVEIYWSPVWSLTNEKVKYLPTQFVYFNAPAAKNSKKRYCRGCSNGNASGNNMEEAILQGFFELVERDCVALWWYNMLKKPGVDFVSFGEPYLLELREYFKSRNREIWALDITSDLGIPAFASFSRRVDRKEEHILFGFGCHLDAKIALTRAVTEMNQMLSMDRYINENCETQIEDSETLHWFKNATVENQPYTVPDTNLKPVCFRDFQRKHSGDIRKDIIYCKELVEELGMEMLVLDQTRSDIGISVAKVIVPGLRHFWARYGPGRLYDVPAKMGWLKKPLKEKDLNPTAMFV